MSDISTKYIADVKIGAVVRKKIRMTATESTAIELEKKKKIENFFSATLRSILPL